MDPIAVPCECCPDCCEGECEGNRCYELWEVVATCSEGGANLGDKVYLGQVCLDPEEASASWFLHESDSEGCTYRKHVDTGHCCSYQTCASGGLPAEPEDAPDTEECDCTPPEPYDCIPCGNCCFSDTSKVTLTWELPTNSGWFFNCSGVETACGTSCDGSDPVNCLAFLTDPGSPGESCFAFSGSIELPFTRTLSIGGTSYVAFESAILACGDYFHRFQALYNCETDRWSASEKVYIYSGSGDVDDIDSYFLIGEFWFAPGVAPGNTSESVEGNCCGNEPWEFYSVSTYSGHWTYGATIGITVTNNNCCKGEGTCHETAGDCDGSCDEGI